MEEKHLDKIREKLYDFELPVDADVWQGIEGSLRRRKLRRFFWYASSAAAVLVAALFVLWPVENVPENSLVEGSQKIAQVIPYPDSNTREDASRQGNAVIQKEVVVQGKKEDVDKSVTIIKEQVVVAEMPDLVAEAVNVEEQAEEVNTVNVFKEEKGKEVEQEMKNEMNGVKDKKVEWEYLADVEEEMAAGKKKYSVAISSGVIPGSSASISASTIRATSAGAGGISQSYNIEQISDTRYSLPLNLGIQFQFALKENLALGIGVNYTMLRSRYDCLINKKKFEVTQHLHYVGIPVNVYGLIAERNRFSFYVNAGAMFEKGVRAVYDLKSYNQNEHSTSSINGVDVSVNGGLGVEYKPGRLVGLYFEPNLVYFINSDMPRSIRTDQPLQIKAELGCRFHF